MSEQRFAFTFGPVQGFVAQARRTRDLWAGSWLLSYLGESAMAAAEEHGAELVLPHRNEHDCGCVTMQRDRMRFGGFPNRFTARAAEPARAARAAATALAEAWERVAAAVWDRFVAAPAGQHGAGTETIWKRQVEHFWEVCWVAADEHRLDAMLVARKNVRIRKVPVEPGVHCSLMGDLQELSGHFGRGARERQEAFWASVRQPLDGLDLEENERLCAIALIKRLFPRVSREAVGAELEGVVSWPSTAWLAARPWIGRAMREAPAQAEAFARAATALMKDGRARQEERAARAHFGEEAAAHAGFASLSGPLFFDAALAAPRSLELSAEVDTQPARDALRDLREAVPPGAEPFYAILLMDGDRMGALLEQARTQCRNGEKKVSGALSVFAGSVEGIVRHQHGHTVYAGGDDLLALLPAPGALACAEKLAETYVRCFEERGFSGATLSGGLVFAHYKWPLRAALDTARDALEEVAKERTGRGALAIGLVQSSGLTACWSAPWDVVLGRTRGRTPLRALSRSFAEDGAFSASYLHSFREQMTELLDGSADRPGAFGSLGAELQEDIVSAIAVAERRRGLGARAAEETLERSQEHVDALLSLTAQWKREERRCERQPGRLGFDGLRIARFLARRSDDGSAGNG